MLKIARNCESRLNSTDPALNPSGSHLRSKNFNNLRGRKKAERVAMAGCLKSTFTD